MEKAEVHKSDVVLRLIATLAEKIGITCTGVVLRNGTSSKVANRDKAICKVNVASSRKMMPVVTISREPKQAQWKEV
ncbi:hypothetical protein ON010_g17921 [Phytophthora cinnamomi]|nr:hypothetical protein ON010_g17921 [Phytophthora cinnamomi]